MTHRMQTTASDEITELPAEHGSDGLARAGTALPKGVMKLERAHARGVDFYPSAPGEGIRSERAPRRAAAEMPARGAPTREAAAITEAPRGLEVTGGRVSRAAQALDAELQGWRARPIGETRSPILDARHVKVRRGGSVASCAAPVAIGIDAAGRRSVLGVSASLSEAEVHRRDFLASLQGRGPHGVGGPDTGDGGGPDRPPLDDARVVGPADPPAAVGRAQARGRPPKRIQAPRPVAA